MSSLIPWLEVTLPGFIYLAALGFLLLSYFKPDCKTIINNHYDKFKDSLPYTAVLVVFASFIVGLTAQFLMSLAISCIWKEYSFDAIANLKLQRDVPESVAHDFGRSWSNLILFRHLVASMLLLGVSLIIRFREKRTRWKIFFIFVVLCVLLTAAYYVHRADYLRMQDAINAKKYLPEQTQQK